MIFFIIASGVVFFATYALCIAPNKSMHSIPELMTKYCPSLITWWIRYILGTWCINCLHRVYIYCVWKQNPLLQIFYLLLVVGAYAVGVVKGFPHVPNAFLDEYHKIIFTGMFLMLLLSFYAASAIPPGYITRDNYKKYNNYEHDGMIFLPNQECRTEQFIKPARSKFCRISGKTVARYDHYCGWTAQPVGAHNHRFFLFFLFLTAAFMLYGGFCCAAIFWHLIDSGKLLEQTFIKQSTGKKMKASYYIVGQYLMYKENLMFATLVTAVVMGVVTFFFFLHHLVLVTQNMTTNEKTKWNNLRREVEWAESVQMERVRRQSAVSMGSLSAEAAAKLEDLPAVPPHVQALVGKKWGTIKNRYNLGSIRANIWEVLSPRCERRDKGNTNKTRVNMNNTNKKE